MRTQIEPPLALLNLGDISDKAPDTRLRSATDGRRLLQACLKEDEQSALQRAIVKGCIDGNPPYPTPRPKDRAWECNLNFREGAALMKSSGVPYYALFANVPYYADCRTAFQQDNPEHGNWCAKITCRFTNLLKRWPEFNWNVQQVSYWMRLHGVGFAFFDKDGDWRFRSIPMGNVQMPAGAASCIDHRLPFICIRVPYRIVELWDRIKDEESATSAGWDVTAVKDAIKFGMKGFAPHNEWWTQSWDFYKNILANRDLVASFTDGDLIFCSHLLVQEFAKPGEKAKISKFIFTENEVVPRKNPPQKTNEEQQAPFLFADPNTYDSFQEALVAFFVDTGDGTYHSVRGIAVEAFGHLETSNRLKCQAVNSGFIDSSVVIQGTTPRNNDRLNLTVWGPLVRLPSGCELKQVNVQGKMQGVMEVDRMLTNHLANNIGQFNQRTLSREDGKGEVPTATQINQQVAKESTLSEGQITLFYQPLDSLYSNMFRIAADPSCSDEEAKRFRKECEEDGVPKEALKEMEYVRACRLSGYGSPQMGLLKMQQGQVIVPMLPEQGKQNWLEDAVTQIYGPEKTDRYAPKEYIPTQDDSIAALENGLIQEGRAPVIASGQDDVVHLVSHFQDASDVLGPLEEAMTQGQNDPQALQEAFQYCQIMLAHAQAHIGRIANDPMRKQQAKMFGDQFSALVSFSGKLHSALRTAIREQQLAAEQMQQATALSALDAAKVRSVETGTAMAAKKTLSNIENQRIKTVAGLQHKALKLGTEIQLDAVETAAEIRQKRNKALSMPEELNAKFAKAG